MRITSALRHSWRKECPSSAPPLHSIVQSLASAFRHESWELHSHQCGCFAGNGRIYLRSGGKGRSYKLPPKSINGPSSPALTAAEVRLPQSQRLGSGTSRRTFFGGAFAKRRPKVTILRTLPHLGHSKDRIWHFLANGVTVISVCATLQLLHSLSASTAQLLWSQMRNVKASCLRGC
jgi:hypothetical protein